MYINLDDGWQGERTKSGEIMPARHFGNVQSLAAGVHRLGLRFGLYSSPGPQTCGHHTGSYGHEWQDAQTYARWGTDYLKYDWCSYGAVATGSGLDRFIKPYRVMRQALDRVGRDIVFGLCQYGMAHVWTWGSKAPVWGNVYRTRNDIIDTWPTVCRNSFDVEADLYPFAGPGHWNDPCMLMCGWGYFWSGKLRPTRLTPHEQLTQFTLWCMLAAPLFMGCDLNRLDSFTISLLTNTEVISVNQDELGIQARRVDRQGAVEVWARPLWDGTCAVALFNRGPHAAAGHIAKWDMLDRILPRGAAPMRGAQRVRDLWRRKSLGLIKGLSVNIPSHSAVMLKVGVSHIRDG